MYQIKRKHIRPVLCVAITTAYGKKKRVNLMGEDIESILPATKYTPEAITTIKGISQKEIEYLIKNKLPHYEKFEWVDTPKVMPKTEVKIDKKDDTTV